MDEHYDIETLAVRAGTVRSQFNEHSEALFLTSSFVFANAAEAAARFKGEQPGPIYARFTNPTVSSAKPSVTAINVMCSSRSRLPNPCPGCNRLCRRRWLAYRYIPPTAPATAPKAP